MHFPEKALLVSHYWLYFFASAGVMLLACSIEN